MSACFQDNEKKQEDFSKIIIGTWKANYMHDTGIHIKAISTYSDNGLCKTFVEYSHSETITHSAIIKENWILVNDELRFTVLESSNDEIAKIGEITKVVIIRLSSDNLTVRSLNDNSITKFEKMDINIQI